jgi:hypothetical protein
MKELMTKGEIIHPVPEAREVELLTAAGFVDVQRVYTGFHFVGFRARLAGAPTAAAAAPPK